MKIKVTKKLPIKVTPRVTIKITPRPTAGGNHNGRSVESAPWLELFAEQPTIDLPQVAWGA